jgi:hypothetical protein
MKKFVTALMLGAGAAFVDHAAAAPAKPASYDGTWSVRLVTESGGVGCDGSVTLNVQHSIAQAQASGRLRASSGSGTWRLATLGCTGRWTAQRGTVQAQTS